MNLYFLHSSRGNGVGSNVFRQSNAFNLNLTPALTRENL